MGVEVIAEKKSIAAKSVIIVRKETSVKLKEINAKKKDISVKRSAINEQKNEAKRIKKAKINRPSLNSQTLIFLKNILNQLYLNLNKNM